MSDSSPSASSPPGPPVRRPISVWVIYVILFLQGSVIIVGTLASVIGAQALVLDAAGTIALVVLYLLSGLVLVLLGFRIFLGAAGARTPSMVLQLLVVVLSFSFFAGGAFGVGMLFLVPAATALILLFVRPTQAWLEARSAS